MTRSINLLPFYITANLNDLSVGDLLAELFMLQTYNVMERNISTIQGSQANARDRKNNLSNRLTSQVFPSTQLAVLYLNVSSLLYKAT